MTASFFILILKWCACCSLVLRWPVLLNLWDSHTHSQFIFIYLLQLIHANCKPIHRVGNLLFSYSCKSLCFWQKIVNYSFTLFKRVNHSFCKEQFAPVTLFKRATRAIHSLLFFFIKAKPKSLIYIFKSSFQFTLEKGTNPTLKKSKSLFIKSKLLLCSNKWKEWSTHFALYCSCYFKKSDGSKSFFL